MDYDEARKQKYMTFGKIYTGESLRDYIAAVPDPKEDETSRELLQYLNSTTECSYSGYLLSDLICYVHEDLTRPSLPAIAKSIRDVDFIYSISLDISYHPGIVLWHTGGIANKLYSMQTKDVQAHSRLVLDGL